jgi:hypothetical protein
MAHAIASSFAPAQNCCSRSGRGRWTASDCKPLVAAAAANANANANEVAAESLGVSRRAALGATAALGITTATPTGSASFAASDAAAAVNPRAYFQRYPTLFAPFFGDDERATAIKEVRWALFATSFRGVKTHSVDGSRCGPCARLTPPGSGSDNPSVKTPVDDTRYDPCNQSDTRK